MDLTWGGLAAFNAILLGAWASPGQAILLALRNAATVGRAAGVATGAGLALVAALWTAAALAGLGAVLAALPPLYTALRIAGALYLIWLGIGMWRSAGAQVAEAPRARRTRAFRQGMLLNLGNPKSVLFAAATLLVVFPQGLSVVGAAVVVANHFLFELVAYALLATLAAAPGSRAALLRLRRTLDRIGGTVMAALGLRILLERS